MTGVLCSFIIITLISQLTVKKIHYESLWRWQSFNFYVFTSPSVVNITFGVDCNIIGQYRTKSWTSRWEQMRLKGRLFCNFLIRSPLGTTLAVYSCYGKRFGGQNSAESDFSSCGWVLIRKRSRLPFDIELFFWNCILWSFCRLIHAHKHTYVYNNT